MPLLKRLRAERPEESFTLSMRTNWDGIVTDSADIDRQLEAFAGAGLQHVMAAPAQADLDGWLRSVDALWTHFDALSR
jgi:hypothetical protein